MKKILKNAKILNISHSDLDGVGCSIALGNIFNRDNITYWYATYKNIDEIIMKADFNKYDFVIMTDISPHGLALLDGKKNLILLDHHDTAQVLHDPENMRAVVEGNCASILTKQFCESTFNTNLSYLDDLFSVINDYDLWINKDVRGKEMNDLFFLYWGHRFRKRFFDGKIEYTTTEIEYLAKRKRELEKLYNKLEFYPLEKINGAVLKVDDRINEVCDRILTKEGFDIVFCKSLKSGNISVRSTLEDIHVGDMLKKYSPDTGGGHKLAGALGNPNGDIDFQTIICDLEQIVYDQLKGK